jgi:hypothetical protein
MLPTKERGSARCLLWLVAQRRTAFRGATGNAAEISHSYSHRSRPNGRSPKSKTPFPSAPGGWPARAKRRSNRLRDQLQSDIPIKTIPEAHPHPPPPDASTVSGAPERGIAPRNCPFSRSCCVKRCRRGSQTVRLWPRTSNEPGRKGCSRQLSLAFVRSVRICAWRA